MNKSIAKTVTSYVLIFMLFTTFSFGDIQTGASHSKSVDWLLELSMDEWVAVAVEPHVDMASLEYGYQRDETSNITTDHARYLLGDRAFGYNLTNQVSNIKSAQLPSGKFADQIDGQGETLVNAHIWGVLGMYIAYEDDYDKEGALTWLKHAQNTDGSFSVYIDKNSTSGTAGSPDLTAMAVCALSVLGLDKTSPEIKDAMTYLEKSMDEAERLRTGASAETLAWSIMAKQFLGESVSEETYEALGAYRRDDGSYLHLKNARRGNRMATYHALLALNGKETGVSWIKNLRFKNGIKTDAGTYLTIERIVDLAKSGLIKSGQDGVFKWTDIRQALINKR
ncbi:prenyltransferase/squalene oxidase repeat-containing protein [Fusibacter sp. JL216-2]|uniref:prenyltransferase/squalene oxidase repeat-containing protein n=1 Tax=Fusibacter sp. JL216-2 TaxID=3071453 RepID=UPI003D34FD25